MTSPAHEEMPAPSEGAVTSERSRTPEPSEPSERGVESIRTGTRLLLVSNDAMRARRRPRAILWMWLFQAALAASVAWAAARAVGASFSRFPNGDGALFADGGYALLEWLNRESAVRGALGAVVAVVVAAGLLLGAVPLIMLLASMAYTTQDLRAPRLAHVMPYVARSLGPMLLLLALGTLAEGALLALAAGASTALDGALDARWGEARAGQAAIGLFVGILAMAAVVGVIHDLSRAAVVRFRVGTFSAIGAGVAAFRKAKLVLLWSWAWRGLVGLLLLGGAYVVTTRLGGRPGVSLAALAVLHQLVAMARVALRASWLARALRAVDRLPPRL